MLCDILPPAYHVINHEKSVARFSISINPCGSLTIVIVLRLAARSALLLSLLFVLKRWNVAMRPSSNR